MAVLLQQVDRRTKLGVLLLDVLLTEEVAFESQVTNYPVEDGTEISDHITQGAKRIRLSGMIATADASGGWGTLSQFGFGAQRESQEAKLIDVIEALERMHVSRELVTVSTGQMIYKDMAFVNMSAQRASGGGQGNWLSINAELVRIRKVNLKTADVPPPENTAGSAAGRAGETGKPAGNTSSGRSNSNTSPAMPERELTSTIYDMRRGTGNSYGTMVGRAAGVNAPL